MQEYHVPVLLTESISSLNVLPDGVYVDATLGQEDIQTDFKHAECQRAFVRF